MANKLPKTPQLLNGRPQYDSSGVLITANHYRRLKQIQRDCEKAGHLRRSPKTFAKLNAYCQMVVKYDQEYQKTFGKKTKSQIGIYIFIIISILAIVYKYTH